MQQWDQTSISIHSHQSLHNGIECVFILREDAVSKEQRRLAIEESKYLGGDMEHTHLVKGLDFALLQKVGRGTRGYCNVISCLVCCMVETCGNLCNCVFDVCCFHLCVYWAVDLPT